MRGRESSFIRYNSGVVCGLQGLGKDYDMSTKCLPACWEKNGNKQSTQSVSSWSAPLHGGDRHRLKDFCFGQVWIKPTRKGRESSPEVELAGEGSKCLHCSKTHAVMTLKSITTHPESFSNSTLTHDCAESPLLFS